MRIPRRKGFRSSFTRNWFSSLLARDHEKRGYSILEDLIDKSVLHLIRFGNCLKLIKSHPKPWFQSRHTLKDSSHVVLDPEGTGNGIRSHISVQGQDSRPFLCGPSLHVWSRLGSRRGIPMQRGQQPEISAGFFQKLRPTLSGRWALLLRHQFTCSLYLLLIPVSAIIHFLGFCDWHHQS